MVSGPRDHSFHAIHPAENDSNEKEKVSFKWLIPQHGEFDILADFEYTFCPVRRGLGGGLSLPVNSALVQGKLSDSVFVVQILKPRSCQQGLGTLWLVQHQLSGSENGLWCWVDRVHLLAPVSISHEPWGK